MLGFLRGIEQGVAREGAAQRAHHGSVLSSKESHLDRLLSQIKYNQQLKFQERADTRAQETHDFNYGDDGMMHLRRNLFKSELEDYEANQEVRNLTRQYQEKLGRYQLGEGWGEMLEDRSLSQDLVRAQIGAYNRPRSTGRSGGPTWAQTRDITVEGLAPTVLKHLKDEGESAVWPWDKRAQFWPPGFEADRPFVSEDPNEITQTRLLRQAGGHLVEELIARGIDTQTALQMVPFYWDQILDAKGSDVLKRLKRSAQPEGYDDLELRKVLRDSVYQGAMNFLQFRQPERPAGAATEGADQLLDTIIE